MVAGSERSLRRSWAFFWRGTGSPPERIFERIGERTPHVMEENLEEIRDTPQVRVSERNRGRTVGEPLPRVTKEILEEVKDIPQERMFELRHVLLAIFLVWPC